MFPSVYFRFKIVISFFLISWSSLIGQNRFSQANFKGEMTNVGVIDAKRWHHQGEIDKSLKKGLEILSSNVELTPIDSFNTYQVLAYNFRSLSANELALEHAKKAIEIMRHIAPKDDSKITWIAPYFSAVSQYDTAIVFMKKNIAPFQKSKDTLSLLKLYNDIGFTFYLNNQFDSAIVYYNKVIKNSSAKEKYKALVGLSTGNLGAIYFAKGEYEKALINFKIDANLSKERNITSYYNAMNAIGESYYFMAKYKEAEDTLAKLLTLMQKETITNLKTYKLLADIYNKTNENAKSVQYLRKYIVLKDSLQNSKTPIESVSKELFDAKISGIKKDLELARSKTKSEEFKNRVYLILVGVFLVLIIISIVYFKNRQAKNNQIHQLEKSLVSTELKNKKKDLTNVVTNLSYKRKFIDEVQDKLKILKNQPEENIKEQINLLIREFSSYKSADENIAVLQTDIDKINLAFFENLGKKHPLLTEKEKELCGLLLLKLSSKDIANMKNITPNAVKKARQRIRKKLPISANQNLITFLENT